MYDNFFRILTRMTLNLLMIRQNPKLVPHLVVLNNRNRLMSQKTNNLCPGIINQRSFYLEV